jgi:hypothetical protein
VEERGASKTDGEHYNNDDASIIDTSLLQLTNVEDITETPLIVDSSISLRHSTRLYYPTT